MVDLGYVITATTGPTANTEYTIKIEAKSGSQKMYINGSEVLSRTYTTTSTTKTNLFLYSRNGNTKTADTTVYLRSCKIWVDNALQRHFEVYLSHENAYDKSGLYDSVTKSFYNISGAYNYYPSKARKIKKIYVGVSNKARKVKRVYVGVNNKAKLAFVNGTGKFNGTPVPTSGWEGGPSSGRDTAYTEYTATNSYGTWKCYSDHVSMANTGGNYFPPKAFNGNHMDTGYNQWMAYQQVDQASIFLELPTGVEICPTSISIFIDSSNDGKHQVILYGYNVATKAWETLYTGYTTSSSVVEKVATLAGTKWFSKFQLLSDKSDVSASRPHCNEIVFNSGYISN